MMISEVMRHLNVESDIRYMLTLYLETLRCCNAGNRLPPGVAALPLRDAAEIESRFTELLGAELSGVTQASCDAQGAISREATEIFGAAYTRLQTLRDAGLKFAPPRAVVLSARNDTARHGSSL
jgi:hypothetical protein